MSAPNANPKLHAALAQAGLCSRRRAEKLIEEGKVRVNGEVAHIGQRIDPTTVKVTVEGKVVELQAPQRYLFLVHKPIGIVSTTDDDLGRETIIGYFHKEVKKNNPDLAKEIENIRLYPVGRLDLESDGLMLLTNDGTLTQQFTHPSYESLKTYQVTVTGRPTPKAIHHLERGVRLKEGYTAPAEVRIIETEREESVLEITIHEGRHQQVRRMCERVGYTVIRLTRMKMGPYHLDDLDGLTYKKV